MTPQEAVELLRSFDDVDVPQQPETGLNDKEWAAILAIPVARIEDAANATSEAMPVHFEAVRTSAPEAGELGALMDRLTAAVATAELARTAERVWGALTSDEQRRCVEKAAKETRTLPTVLGAKKWMAGNIEANAREAIRSFGGGDWKMAIAKSGSPAVAWLTGYRLVGDVLAAPGQASKVLGLRRWPFG